MANAGHNTLGVQVDNYLLFSYNEDLLPVQNIEVLEDQLTLVNLREAMFTIMAGPSKTDKKTYVLEIHYRESEQVHRRMSWPFVDWNRHLYLDFAEEAHYLALEFCKEQGFTIEQHLNSWPEYQALIEKKDKSTSLILL